MSTEQTVTEHDTHVEGVVDKEELCKIEATVTTGFEECARGEAREKFATDVSASRGKIMWEVPLKRLHEVLTMGSIDNCRVVMHRVPHFKFTDTNDSLARLQKMILDVDWESGLKAWDYIFHFPYPISSKPDVIPTPEELVDVVIANLPQPGDKSKKKNKGKGKGKKKDSKTKSDKDGIETEEKIVKDENKQASQPTNENHDSNTNENKSFVPEKDVSGASRVEEDLTESEVNDGESRDSRVNLTAAKAELKKTSIPAPKTVVIKKITSSEMEPKIDIKVLKPPNVFPAEIMKDELRHLEPMEVDSPNCSFKSSSRKTQNVDSAKKSSAPDAFKELDSSEDASNSDFVNSESSVLPASSTTASAFATSIIKKLTTPPTSPSQKTVQSSSCATPPSTPILGVQDPFLSKTETGQDTLEPKASSSDDNGSSVDPISYNKVTKFSQSSNVTLENSLSLQSAAKTVDEGALVENCSEKVQINKESFVEEQTLPKLTRAQPGENNAADLIPQSGDTREDNVTSSNIKSLTPTSDHSPAISAPAVSNDGSNHLSKDLSTPQVKPCENESSSSGSIEKTESKDSDCVRKLDPTKPKFRVTCNRVGEHSFDSSSAAASFGSAVITYFKWPVDLKKFNIEVLLNIDNEEVSVSLALTKTSLHNRNIVAFGPTTLRATICYNMLRLCRIKNGDFICDPMCGTSAIPVESALNWTNCYTFGGDFHEKAMERTVSNIKAIQQKQDEKKRGQLKIDAVQWNIQNFPLRDACVDVFVSDLPFGHRLGSRTVNRTLYPTLLTEMARTARSGARACLLTEDRNSLIKAIQTLGRYWQRRVVLSVNIGGLSGFVFVLVRTTTAMVNDFSKWSQKVQNSSQTGSLTDVNTSKVMVPNSVENAKDSTQVTGDLGEVKSPLNIMIEAHDTCPPAAEETHKPHLSEPSSTPSSDLQGSMTAAETIETSKDQGCLW